MTTATSLEASGAPWHESVDFVVEAERIGLDVCWVAEEWCSDAPSALGSGVTQVSTCGRCCRRTR